MYIPEIKVVANSNCSQTLNLCDLQYLATWNTEAKTEHFQV
jgi:hypothetical protein